MKKTMKQGLCALLAALLAASLLASCAKKAEENTPSGVPEGETVKDGENITDVELDLQVPKGTGRRNIDEEDPMPYGIDAATERALLEGVDDFFVPIFFPDEKSDLAPELVAFGKQFADKMRGYYLDGYRAIYTQMQEEGLLRPDHVETLLKKMENKLTDTMFYRTGDVVFQDDDHATMNCCLSVSSLEPVVFFGDEEGNMSFENFCRIAGIDWDAIQKRLDEQTDASSEEEKRERKKETVYGLLDAAMDDIAISVFGMADDAFSIALEKKGDRWVPVDAY